MKFLKSNIFIFFILGVFFSIMNTNYANWDNFHREDALKYWLIYIGFTLCIFLPFFIAIILNLIIKFSKNEKIQKIFKIIMIITNVLSVVFFLLLLTVFFVVFVISSECSNAGECLFGYFNSLLHLSPNLPAIVE